MMNRRREMLLKKSGGGRLPDEFQEVEYIEASASSGTFIDTGIFFEGNSKVVIDCTFREGGSNDASQKAIFGCVTQGNKNNWLLTGTLPELEFGIKSSKSLQYNYCGTMIQRYGTAIPNFASHERHTYEASNELVVDDTPLTSTAQSSTTTDSTSTTISFFAHHSASGYTRQVASLSRIYSAQVFKGENKQRDFVPCRRKADDVSGLYDLVERQFYSSSGNNNFTAGDDV